MQVLRRTKIVATVGPATATPEALTALVQAGVDVFRINFSHGTHPEHERVIALIDSVRTDTERPIAVLADLPGPKLRLGPLAQPRMLVTGTDVVLAAAGEAIDDDLELGFEVDFGKVLKPGRAIMIADGAVRLRAKQARGGRVTCTVEVGGVVSSHKGVNMPGCYLPIPSITERDREHLAFAIEHDVDYLAQSFVRRAEDVEDLKRLIRDHGGRQRLIAKIEKAEAVEQLDAIVAAADGAHGRARRPRGRDRRRGRAARAEAHHPARPRGRPPRDHGHADAGVDDLESAPTRAEASDVANAILDGTAAVMLSGETAVGEYAVEAVQTMVRIALAIEPSLDYLVSAHDRSRLGPRYISDVVGHAACDMAEALGVAAVIVPTVTGESAREVSKHRPRRPIVACTPSPGVQRQLMLDWAVVPLLLEETETVEGLWQASMQAVQTAGLAGPGDRVVITSGTNVNRPGATNTILVQAL